MADEECATGLYCELEEACPGECTYRGGFGDPCYASRQCGEGFGCDGTGACVTAVPVGAACTDDECFDGAYCAGDAEGGICQDAAELYSAAAGQPCGQVGLCQLGLFCVADPGEVFWLYGGHCEATRLGSGATCRSSYPDQCPIGEYCQGAESESEGTCVPLSGEGQACTYSGCEPELTCVDGTCLPYRHLGETCQGGDQCYSETCEGVCIEQDGCYGR